MAANRTTDAQRREALANCIALGQPLTLVPERADLCAELLESQAALIARLSRAGEPWRWALCDAVPFAPTA